MCRLSRGASAGLADVAAAAAAAAPPEQVAQVAQAMAQNPGARGMDLAAKMMEKMGWKSGLGLGRNKQVRSLEAGVGLHLCNVGTAQFLNISTSTHSVRLAAHVLVKQTSAVGSRCAMHMQALVILVPNTTNSILCCSFGLLVCSRQEPTYFV